MSTEVWPVHTLSLSGETSAIVCLSLVLVVGNVDLPWFLIVTASSVRIEEGVMQFVQVDWLRALQCGRGFR
jgi:hypothetical protein